MTAYHPIHEKFPTRRNNLAKRARYSSYKAELRLDFAKRCGYCGTLDYYSGGKCGFHIDHFAPKIKFSHLTHEYTNLVYSCPICNLGKSDDWPTNDPQISHLNDIGFIDPCSPDYGHHLARDKSGQIVHLTALGMYIHKKLKLSLKRRQICWLIDKMESQLDQLRTLIDSKTSNSDLLKAHYELSNEYRRQIGILKSE